MSGLTDYTPEKEWQSRFLAALAVCPNITGAARVAGITRQQAYNVRKSDPDFALAWDDALESAIDDLEGSAYERARTDDTTLTIFLLKAHRPDKYRDKVSTDHSGAIDIRIIHEEADRDPASGSPSGPEGSSLEFK